ncbi:hypothetical protein Tco_0115738 [Tanacetum coccineum]
MDATGSVKGTAGTSQQVVDSCDKTSFVNVISSNHTEGSSSKKAVRIKEMRNSEVVAGARVAIPLEAVEEVRSRFANTLYGYFIGKRLAFPLVENYVKNTWAKFGLKRIMLDGDFFLFQFESKEGMNKVIESGPWLIKLVPLILNIWTPNTVLKKEEVKHAPVWVKLYNVPVVAYSEVGLSLITTQIGKPIMLDSYTSSMCMTSWGKKEYARALIEVSAEEILLESMVIAIPFGDGTGHSLATIDIEYEWRPPRCDNCRIFDHTNESCPKNPKVAEASKENNDGFTEVKKKKKGKAKQRQVEGIRFSKSPLNLKYRKIDKGNSSKPDENMEQPKKMKPKDPIVTISNSFNALDENKDEEKDDEFWGSKEQWINSTVLNESDSDNEEMILEDKDEKRTTEGASTPVILENKLSICTILESHVSVSKLDKVCPFIFRHWDWTTNGNLCSKGTRIMIGWNKYDVDVTVIAMIDQVIHIRIWLRADKKELFCSFVYGHNKYSHRRILWDNLCVHKVFVGNRPWCLLGDFNAALFLEDSTAGSSTMDIAMREFKACVEEIEVMDVQCSGLQYTWNQKPRGGEGILKKIDRVLGNLDFNDSFVGAHVLFQPYRISDHSPAVLKLPSVTNKLPRPFKFTNILTQHAKFKEVVSNGWAVNVSGFYMFKVVKRLKGLKNQFRKLLYSHGNIHENVRRLRSVVDKAQLDLDSDPFNASLRDHEARCVSEFNDAIILQERFLKQRSKIQWLKEGDLNTAYFHKAVKARVSRSRIDIITNSLGNVFENDQVATAFVDHYTTFLGQADTLQHLDTNDLFYARLLDQDAANMVCDITTKEVKDAMFSMGNDKSPGPDGYTAAFFKDAWEIVGSDVVNAVKEFFVNGKLLKELNHTVIALIPKIQNPTRINDFRPISCCNVLFKCISKIIANRIKGSLMHLISPNQSAFVPGRSIADNILLTHELMHNYHLDRGVARCAFKVDIQKAYDTVDWGFLKSVLIGFGFHEKMIAWIMECVSTTSFSINLNGSFHGHFKGKRGLRQGDPLSPYLFTMVMEVLTLILRRKIRNSDDFRYHRFCEDLELINLCFADDLFLFSHGDDKSAKVIMEALNEFKFASGLVPSLPKSTAYFCNVLNYTKIAILQIMPFEEGSLPVKYLGVPLVPSRLVYKDCKELIEKVEGRINDWKNKSLSIAGRLQLIHSVIASLHVYWASMFVLPSRVLLDIEQSMRDFLWCQGKIRKGKSKVAWEDVCLPKNEGGLGVKRLDIFNKALMSSHIWKLLIRKDSLWVKWIHTYKLRNRNFWDFPFRGSMTWAWRKILQLRPVIREFIWYRLGNGHDISLWYDKWCSISPLADVISNRDLHRVGLTTMSKVRDIIHDGSLSWPADLEVKYPILNSTTYPHVFPLESDKLEWRFLGAVEPFSVSTVWKAIRPRDVKVTWSNVVWFSNCIPRHAFNLWLVMKRRLKTQDMLRSWDLSSSLNAGSCLLCSSQPDSHEHLFFECTFSKQVWAHMSQLAGCSLPSNVYDVVNSIIPFANRRTSMSIVTKLILAASTYFIWQERNERLFNNQHRSANQVIECISASIRLKLISCRFKRSTGSLALLRRWKLPDVLIEQK